MALPPDQIRRRVKAARALAGLSIPDLAKAVNEPGLGDRTLRAMEGEKGRPFRKMELEAIARVCGLPYEFFTVDFEQLARLQPEYVVPVDLQTTSIPDLFGEITERLSIIEDELGLRDATRRTGRSLAEALDAADDAETAAGARTRDEADASQEDEPAPAPATRRSGRQTAG